ncbi:MAG TPA: pilus assembly protein TadG-related protein [Gaiellaceae bacterium]|jgi:hypothetical protein
MEPRIDPWSEVGQSLVITLLFLSVLGGAAAAVLDVGSWYRADRKLQANADAAALAGAQELPESTSLASSAAIEYADHNDGGLHASGIRFRESVVENDTIEVEAERAAPGFFAKIFGLGTVMVRAKAVARSGAPSKARWAAPFGVERTHPMLAGPGCPCWQDPTTLELDKVGPGAFHIINIDGSHGGTGPGTLADWISQGLEGYMDLGWYYSDPGAKFNSSHVKSALDGRIGDELLFPIYSEVRGSGSNLEYRVVGWAGFHLSGYDIHGSKSKLNGWFERVIWDGIQSESAPEDDFGARTVSLVE